MNERNPLLVRHLKFKNTAQDVNLASERLSQEGLRILYKHTGVHLLYCSNRGREQYTEMGAPHFLCSAARSAEPLFSPGL